MKKIFMALFLFTLVMAKCEVPEICGDHKDNNQNGLVDENCFCTRGQAQDCDTGLPGICSKGKQTCKLGQWSTCVQQSQSSTEVCGDGLDNNCDGQVDEGCTVILNSIDEYDGAVHPDSSWAFYSDPIQSLGVGSWYQYIGFVTFNIENTIGNLQPASISLKVYNASKVGDCYGGTKHIFANVMQTTDEEYSLWKENCQCYPYPNQCALDTDGDDIGDLPGACKNPDPLNALGSFEMHKADQSKPWEEVDWWILDSSDFANLAFSQFSSRKFLSISFQYTCIQAPFNSWDGIMIEDGGNHLGTGNVPTLTISY
jgi:hypothetical protein